MRRFFLMKAADAANFVGASSLDVAGARESLRLFYGGTFSLDVGGAWDPFYSPDNINFCSVFQCLELYHNNFCYFFACHFHQIRAKQ